MPTFAYTARKKTGEKVEGTMDGHDRRAIMLKIEQMGHIPVSVQEKKAAAEASAAGKKKPLLTWHGRGERMGPRDLLIFTTELSDLLAAGMTLGNALNSLANRRSDRPGDKIIAGLRDAIVQGSSLSEAMAQHPKTFSQLYVSMIRAGEASGALDEVLRRLVTHYERMQEMKEKIVMALVYPALVMLMGGATLVFSMVYVIPKFKTIFDSIGQALPLPTRILIALSRWTAHYGLFAAIALAIGIVLLNRGINTERGRLVWDRFLLRVPLLRGIIASGIYANFARTLGTLMTNGVPVLQALGIVEKIVGNVVIGNLIHAAKEKVTDGTTISGPMAAGGVLPPMMTDMLAIGERTGDMPLALSHIARRYENELDRNIKIFTTALEPILIVVVGVVVGFVAISILMAVFSLTNGLG